MGAEWSRQYRLRPAGRCCDFAVVTATSAREALAQYKHTAYAGRPEAFPKEWEIYEGGTLRAPSPDLDPVPSLQLSLL